MTPGAIEGRCKWTVRILPECFLDLNEVIQYERDLLRSQMFCLIHGVRFRLVIKNSFEDFTREILGINMCG